MDRSLDKLIGAISDPTRRAIIAQLKRGPARISDVAAPFSMSLTAICKHVRVLERAGLVRRIHEGRENTLELSAQPLREVARWVFQYERFWNTRLDHLWHENPNESAVMWKLYLKSSKGIAVRTNFSRLKSCFRTWGCKPKPRKFYKTFDISLLIRYPNLNPARNP